MWIWVENPIRRKISGIRAPISCRLGNIKFNEHNNNFANINQQHHHQQQQQNASSVQQQQHPQQHQQHQQHHQQPHPQTSSLERLSRPMAFDKMEILVREMQDSECGVPVRSQKLFLTSIPSAFMGSFTPHNDILSNYDMKMLSYI